MMQRITYRNAAGGLTVYEYPPQPYVDAATKCRRALGRSKVLIRAGARSWQAGHRGRRFQNATVESLIRSGHAVRLGDVVVRA